MYGLLGLLPTSGENLMSTAPLEIYLLNIYLYIYIWGGTVHVFVCLFKINEKKPSIVDFFCFFSVVLKSYRTVTPNRGTYRTVTSVYRATPNIHIYMYIYICMYICVCVYTVYIYIYIYIYYNIYIYIYTVYIYIYIYISILLYIYIYIYIYSTVYIIYVYLCMHIQ